MTQKIMRCISQHTIDMALQEWENDQDVCIVFYRVHDIYEGLMCILQNEGGGATQNPPVRGGETLNYHMIRLSNATLKEIITNLNIINLPYFVSKEVYCSMKEQYDFNISTRVALKPSQQALPHAN